MKTSFSDLLQGRRIAAFLGGAGSGKTEIALNVALGLRAETDRRVQLFDMDQTKPLFRARDAAERLASAGVEFHSNTDTSIEDVATVAPGVLSALAEEDSIVLLDVGGNEQGARVIGQFFRQLNADDSILFLPVNPYRPWSSDPEELFATIDMITAAARAGSVQIISNPNFCDQTVAEDVVSGNEKLKAMLQGRYELSFVTALEPLCEALEGRLTERIVPLRIQIRYPWMDE